MAAPLAIGPGAARVPRLTTMLCEVFDALRDAARYLVEDIGATTVGVGALAGALWIARSDRRAGSEQASLEDLRDALERATAAMIEEAQEAAVKMATMADEDSSAESYGLARQAHRAMTRNHAALVIRLGRRHAAAIAYANVRDHLMAFAPAQVVAEFFPDSPVEGWSDASELDEKLEARELLEDLFLDQAASLVGASIARRVSPGRAIAPG